MYPVLATYKSLESYNQLAQTVAALNVSVGGVSIPVHALLKKATGDTTALDLDERRLQFHAVALQKWVVYWIVFATGLVVERVLFLRYIVPLYGMVRFFGTVWLLLPIASDFSAFNADAPATDLANNWLKFKEDGCGLVYFKYLKPVLDGESVDLERAQAQALKYSSSYVGAVLGLVSRTKNQAALNYLWSFASKPQEEEPVVEADYDVIDKPEEPSSVTQRKGWIW